jgi:PHD/YefM family antitoxin component YafN of YafNO toxin-antitoxin module
MQKTLAELFSLPETEVLRLVEREPLLITQGGEPRFVAQSLTAFESMVRRIRVLETERHRQIKTPRLSSSPPTGEPSKRGKVVPLRPKKGRD